MNPIRYDRQYCGNTVIYMSPVVASLILLVNPFQYTSEEIIGANIARNGGFNIDYDGWTPYLTIPIVADGEIEIPISLGSTDGGIYQTYNVTIGKTYIVSVQARKGTADNGQLRTYDASTLSGTMQSAQTTSDTNEPLTLSITPTTNKFTVYLGSGGDIGDSAVFDDVEVHSIFNPNQNTLVENAGTLPHMKMNTGRGLHLTLLNKLPIPIPYELGVEKIKNDISASDFTFSNVTQVQNDNTLTITASSDGTAYAYLEFRTADIGDITIGSTILINYECVSSSDMQLVLYSNVIGNSTSSDTPMGQHLHVYNVDTYYIRFDFNSHIAGDTIEINLDALSVKQITNPNAYLTYLDHDLKKVVALGNSVNGGSSEELVKNGDFSDGTTVGWNSILNEILTIENETMKIASTTHTNPKSYYPINSRVGKKYEISVTIIGGTSGNDFRVRAGSTTTGFTYLNETTTSGTHHFNFTSTDVNTYIHIVGVGAIGTYFYVDNVSVEEILPTSTHYDFSDIRVSDILVHSNPMTAEALAILNANRTLIAKVGLEPTGIISEIQTDLAPVAYYPCTEKEGFYVVDARAGYGDEQVIGGDFNTPDDWGIGNGWVIDNGVASSSGGVRGDIRQFCLRKGFNLIEIEVDLAPIMLYTNQPNFTSIATVNDSGKYTILYYAPENDSLYIYNHSNLSPCAVSNVSVREATAEEIANYSDESPRQNMLGNSISGTTHLKMDALGVPYTFDDKALNFHSDGYGETGWIPKADEDWTIELVLDNQYNGLNEFNGNGETDINTRLYIGKSTGAGTLYFRLGNIALLPTGYGEDEHMMVMVYSQSTKKAKAYINGVFISEYGDGLFTGSNHSFYVGGVNLNGSLWLFPYSGAIPHFNVEERALTATEVLNNYSKWKGL